jgi:tetratricopeptide (TPR) repeat protein
MAQAARAFTAGRLREAALAWDRAEAEAQRPRDRLQARFLAAMALARDGDTDGALVRLDAVAQESPEFEHGARAALEAARLRYARPQDRARAVTDLEALCRTRPDTGPARRALSLLVLHLDAEDPSGERTLALLGSLRGPLQGTGLEDGVRWEEARRLERASRETEAAEAYEALLTAIPYPHNRHWDDASLAEARLLRARDPRRALAVLDRALAVREVSYSNGSYEAPRFPDCAMLRGALLQALGETEAAARAYHFVYTDFPTARVRDDALWAEAEVLQGGSPARACAVYATLLREFPCTRFGRRARERHAPCGPAPEPSAEGRARCQ